MPPSPRRSVLVEAYRAKLASVEQQRSEKDTSLSDRALEAMLEQAVNQRGYLLFRSESTYNDVFAQREKMLGFIEEAKKAAAGDAAIIASLDAMKVAADVFHTRS